MTTKKIVFLGAAIALTGVVTAGGATYARGIDGEQADMSQQQRERVEQRKTEIKARVEARKEAVKQRLEDRRLTQCERRQDRVNRILERGVKQNTKQLAVFQKIEERVKQFYAEKNLSADGYEAAATNADEKEAAAVAAIEVAGEVTFDCETADANKPGAVIKQAMTSRHASLKEYRTAIKDLILVVKQALGDKTDTSEDTSGTPEEPAPTDATAGEEQ